MGIIQPIVLRRIRTKASIMPNCVVHVDSKTIVYSKPNTNDLGTSTLVARASNRFLFASACLRKYDEGFKICQQLF